MSKLLVCRLLPLLMFCTGCMSPRIENPAALDTVISGVKARLAVVRGTPIPKHLLSNGVKRGGEFDASTLMREFPNLSLPSGCVLDWVYQYDSYCGAPALYIRRSDQQPYMSYKDYVAAVTQTALDKRTTLVPLWADAVIADGSPSSYVQLFILITMADQFYQFWHAAHHDSVVICTKKGLSEWVGTSGISLSDSERDAVAKLDPTPKAWVNGRKATVEVLCYSWAGGGLSWRRLSILRQPPRRLLDYSETYVIRTGYVYM